MKIVYLLFWAMLSVLCMCPLSAQSEKETDATERSMQQTELRMDRFARQCEKRRPMRFCGGWGGKYKK